MNLKQNLGEGDRVLPPTLLTRKFLTYQENRSKEKMENGEEKKKNRKREDGNWKWKEEKIQNEERFSFFFSLVKTTEICFGSTKMGNFLPGKSISY